MKNIFSYLFPIQLKSYQSKLNGQLEVNLINGNKTLDTAISNYSYGSLQKILKAGLEEIGLSRSTENILVLGLGAGSIIETVRKDFNSNCFIELVEIDEEIIRIAESDFNVNSFENIHITNVDALEYLKQTDTTFEIIVVDIFIVNTIPEAFTQAAFIKDLCKHLKPNGKVIYNTIAETLSAKELNNIKQLFIENSLAARILKDVEWTNNLVIAEKERR
ncbi:MAG: fused MFS/spermidine synthase [Chitinophagales bacterium]|nr:fused MFS/spermidine synthase [Chitinophagales bacterium]